MKTMSEKTYYNVSESKIKEFLIKGLTIVVPVTAMVNGGGTQYWLTSNGVKSFGMGQNWQDQQAELDDIDTAVNRIYRAKKFTLFADHVDM